MDLLRITNLLPLAAAEGGEHHGPSFWGLVFYVGFVLALIGLVTWLMHKGLKARVFKNPVTQLAEQMYLFIENMVVGIIGPHGRKYIPFIGTFWLVIFVGNVVALFFPTAPTADLAFNLAMALIAVGYVQHEGIKGHADHLRHQGKDVVSAWVIGFFKHIAHFSGPKLAGALLIITPLIFIVEIISELMKNISLSLRLYGNMYGGHAAVEALNNASFFGYKVLIPVGGFLLVVKLLTVVVQALVFTLLTCVYISLVTHHDEPSHGHEPAHAH